MITRDAHLPAALACHNVDIVALVDPVVDRAAALASQYAIDVAVHSGIEGLIGTVDGVIIATPNHTHRELAVRCLESRINVLLEKPVATSLADCGAIEQAARVAQKIVAVGYCTRFQHGVQVIARLTRQEILGAPHKFVVQHGVALGVTPLSNYILNEKESGGGALIINGSHSLDRILFWFGYPERIAFADDSAGGPEANAVAKFWYPSRGLTGLLRISKSVNLPPGVVIEFARGTVVFREGECPTLSIRSTTFPSDVWSLDRGDLPPETFLDMYLAQVDNFVDCCQQDKRPLVTLEDGILTQRLIKETYEARQQLCESTFIEVVK